MSWSDFFAMGGYAFYVWGAYGFAAIVLILNVLAPLRRRRLVLRTLRQFTRATLAEEQ
jgi:heme exporter protein D